jgi:putative ABC transport system permease protein
MLKNFFKIALRNLWKKKVFSIINIAGLAVGVAASVLIFLVMHYELSYDGYQSKRDRIFRVTSTLTKSANGEAVEREGSVPILLPDAMRLDFPQFERVAALWNVSGAQIHVPGPRGLEDEHVFKQNDGIFFTEPSLYNLFDFVWLEGNASGLSDPNTVVLNQSVANTFFGNPKNAIGKTIQLWSFRVPLKVTGVFKDLPDNTDVPVSIGASYATFRKINQQGFADVNQWFNPSWNSECYVLLGNGKDIRTVAAQLPRFVGKYYPADLVKGATRVSLGFQPLKEIHLDTRFGTWKGDALTPKELWALAIIGSFLLLVACINFINLATAQSVSRAKEIGVRKVLGSTRTGLLSQFLQETALISLVAVVLGTMLAWLAVPYLGGMMKKAFSLDLWQNPSILLFLVITVVMVTLLSGFYPGMILSRFNPAEAIKSKISAKVVGGISLRRGLVVVQFVIAQLLVIGTLVVVRQMEFFRSQPMGFEKKAVALLELPSDSLDKLKYTYLEHEVLSVPGVRAVSLCMDAPASWGSSSADIYFGNDPVKKDFGAAIQYADTGYLRTFQIGLAEGRIPYPEDSVREVMINETLVKDLGLRFSSDALGKTIAFYSGNAPRYTIVGVIHDYNSKSLRDAVVPLALLSNKNAYNYVAFRMDADKLSTTLSKIHRIFTGTYPYYIYDLNFLDDRIESFYHTEGIISQLFKVFAFLAIFISCLGLYGLVSFMAMQKTKEVGIRKVLGASVQSIVYMFSKEWTVLLGIAFLISAPLGYYFMHQWLNGFYYHVSLGLGVFALAIGFSIIITWITVGYKAIRAAFANPVDSLRAE